MGRRVCGRGRSILAMLLMLGLLLGMGARPASAIVFQDAASQAAGLGAGNAFLDGEAQLIVDYTNGTAAGCSGSLLAGGAYVLTAAHCVTGDNGTLTASNVWIDFANVGLTVASSSYTVDPVWNGNLYSGGDLAVVALASPITSIAGYQLNLGSSAENDPVMLAGYGLSGTGASGAGGGFGTLYFGTNIYLGAYPGIAGTNTYGFEPSGSEAATIAPGDSGGATFASTGGSYQIVGVHDFTSCDGPGCGALAGFGSVGGDTSVYANAAFLDAYLVPEPATAPLLAGALGLLVTMARRQRA